MIIALPATNHDHLADALVRDLAFVRRHVDQPIRDLLLALDPLVDSGVTMANMGPSPRLSSRLEQMGGTSDEERWSRLLNPPRPGAASDRTAAEVKRLLDVLRSSGLNEFEPGCNGDDGGNAVIIGVELPITFGPGPSVHFVGIEGRADFIPSDPGVHWISPAGVVGEQEAIVAYAKSLREARVEDFEDPHVPSHVRGSLAELLHAEAVASVALNGDTQSLETLEK